MKNALTKRSVGRPRKTLSSVLPNDWKEQILNMMAQGMSEVEVRAKLSMLNGKFHEQLWYSLQDRNEEFSQTIKIGKLLSMAWWEEQGRTNITSKEFQTALWFINMKNRFGWRDKPEEESNEEFINQMVEIINKNQTIENRVKQYAN